MEGCQAIADTIVDKGIRLNDVIHVKHLPGIRIFSTIPTTGISICAPGISDVWGLKRMCNKFPKAYNSPAQVVGIPVPDIIAGYRRIYRSVNTTTDILH